jgi:8-oxo-dGTP pyrophosphatase MutT (NUDIX family)
MVIRDADGGPGIEVFVLQRAAGASFAAGFYVFPGGAVDAGDGDTEVESFSGGLDDATASAALGVEAGGLAYWVAAIRECFEEAGVLLARRADTSEPAVADAADRARVHDGTLSIVELCRRDGLVLDTAPLRYVAHWVTPEAESPRRFDTRFFLAAASVGHDGVHDDRETVASRWVRPGDALALAESGQLMLLPPTTWCMRFLAEASSTSDALARADAAGPPLRILPVPRLDDRGRMIGVDTPDGYYPVTGLPNR